MRKSTGTGEPAGRPERGRSRFDSKGTRVHPRSNAPTDAAVATAARHVLIPVLSDLPSPPFPQACIDAGIASVEADYEAALDAIPNGPAERKGIKLGVASAAAILALRADDGSDTLLVDTAYPQGTDPGQYRFTPGTPFALAPGWGDVTPLVLRTSAQFRADLPYDVASSAYTADFDEVKSLGGNDTTTPSDRTAEQTEIALFWVESSPLQWERIARILAADAGLDEWESARLFGLLNMALADGYVGSFETKYLYNYWRPVTAIQLAATDGKSGHGRRPHLDSVGDDPSNHGPRLGAQRRGRCRGTGLQAVLQDGPDELRDVQPDAAGREHVQRRVIRIAIVHQLHAGGG